jgi:tRNA pseudouridine55 synthase
MSSNTDGILLIDKPTGWTSHDALAVLRKALNIKKIGHSGTLDPMAKGLIIALIGKAVKIQSEFQKMPKTYKGTIYFGKATDTWDAEGKIIRQSPLPKGLTAEKIKETVLKMQGKITQIIPPYSAAKHNGIPLYKLARQNKKVPVKEKKVIIYGWSDLRWKKPCLDFTMECSSGTYVRSAAYELGRQLGCPTHLKHLKRTKINRFNLKNAINAEKLKILDRQTIISKILPL